MKKLLFIYNPHAGRERIRQNLSDIVLAFSAAGYEVIIRPTLLQGETSKLAQECPEDVELLVCSGGDGTLNEAVNGIMKRPYGKLPIGYIPAGSTNDFSKSLGLATDMVKAAQIAVSGSRFACDIGSFNGQNFCYVVAFGAFTDVSYDTDQSLKNVLGHAAYIIEAMKRLHTIRSYEVKIEWDGEMLIGKFLLGIVCNSISIGGFKGIAGKNVELNDGLFEVLLVKEPDPDTDLSEVASALASGNIIENSPNTVLFKTSKLKVTSLDIDAMPWTIDGEYGGNPSEANINVIPLAVDFIVPPPK